MQLHRVTIDEAPPTPLVRLAVRADGRRRPTQAVVDDEVLASLPADTIVVLDHAGPAASRWSLERSVAVDAVCDPVSGRRARAVADSEWSALVSAWKDAARLVRASGRLVGVAVDGDGLLHAALSPLQSPSRPDRVLEVLAACAPCIPLLTIEDLAPGGLDASAGVAFARVAIMAARATTIMATAGTGWLLPLRDRRKGGSVDETGLALASAGWCMGRVDASIVGVVRPGVPVAVAVAAARRLGLTGVVMEEFDPP